MKIPTLSECEFPFAIPIRFGRIPRLLLIWSASVMLARICAGQPGVFVGTDDLTTARFSHTATLLPNGKVLVAGGIGADEGEVGSAELYDRESGMWTLTGSLVNARDSHTATLLPNGKVLVAGGYGTAGPLASAELYNPTTGTWSATGHLAVARYFATATLLRDGKVLVTGGTNLIDHTLASAELYDPDSGTWTSTGSMVIKRNWHTATLLSNAKVMVAGGFGPTGLAAQSAEIYNPDSGTWMLTGSMVSEHLQHTATLLPDGKVLVAGSNACCAVDAEVYDPASGTWRSTSNMIRQRTYGHTATLLQNGMVLVAAGFFSGGVVGEPIGELYAPVTETWTGVSNTIPPGRAFHTATLLGNGQVLVAGGAAEFGQVWTSAQLYIGQSTPPFLLNVSTRLRVLTDDSVLIAGFIVAGTDLKRVLIRGIGPSLTGFGSNLPDPTLELHQGSTTIATNDNWKTRPDGSSQQGDVEATTIPPTNDFESAILMILSPGAYTAILAGRNGGTGVGLVEVYDLGQGATSQLANLSTRGFVDTGDDVMIGGVIVGGGSRAGTARVLVRALGPSVPLPGALGDPTLELHDGSGALIALNDNWKVRPDGSSQQAEIEATGIAPTNDLESALLQTLPAGNYTAIVRGKNNTTGVGLAESYNLPIAQP